MKGKMRPPTEEERLSRILNQIRIAQNKFNNVTDPFLIDSAIYEEQAANLTLRSFISEKKGAATA